MDGNSFKRLKTVASRDDTVAINGSYLHHASTSLVCKWADP